MTVVFKEKMQIPANVIDELVTGVGSDIRQVLNMLSTWKLHNDTMDYEEGKMLYVIPSAILRASSHLSQCEGKREIQRDDSVQHCSEDFGSIHVLCDVA
jgi:hypothetical protein